MFFGCHFGRFQDLPREYANHCFYKAKPDFAVVEKAIVLVVILDGQICLQNVYFFECGIFISLIRLTQRVLIRLLKVGGCQWPPRVLPALRKRSGPVAVQRRQQGKNANAPRSLKTAKTRGFFIYGYIYRYMYSRKDILGPGGGNLQPPWEDQVKKRC